MSWWDTSHFTSLATTALKNAQKKIDKVLDIPDNEVDVASAAKFESSQWTSATFTSTSHSANSTLLSPTNDFVSATISPPESPLDHTNSLLTERGSPVVQASDLLPAHSASCNSTATKSDGNFLDSTNQSEAVEVTNKKVGKRASSEKVSLTPKKTSLKLNAVKIKSAFKKESRQSSTETDSSNTSSHEAYDVTVRLTADDDEGETDANGGCNTAEDQLLVTPIQKGLEKTFTSSDSTTKENGNSSQTQDSYTNPSYLHSANLSAQIDQPISPGPSQSSSSNELLLRSVGSDMILVDNQKDDNNFGSSTIKPSTSSDAITKSSSSDGTVVEQLTSSLSTEAFPVIENIPEISSTENSDEPLEHLTSSTNTMQASTCSDTFVKCELKSRVDSTDDFQRGTPSEFSDFGTATSSDIEIISLASTYGDGNGEGRMVDFMPLKGVFKTKLRQLPSEVSSNSSQVSPGSETEEGTAGSLLVEKSEKTESKMDSEQDASDANNPLDTQTLLKKLAHLAEVLEVRETKLVTVMTENSELLEVNSHLKRRIEQMEETNGDIDNLKDEFGVRIHELEKKLQNALREKESVKHQLLSVQDELCNRTGTSDKMQQLVEEKDEQISSLMQEGEKLQKQQLQSNTLIKKLRKKEKEHDEITRAQREKIDSLKLEVEKLKNVLDSKIDNETKHSDLIKQLNAAVSKYQTENTKLLSDLEDSNIRTRRAESAVDNSYKEIAELHKSSAAKDSLIRELRESCDEEVKTQLKIALEKQQRVAVRDSDHLTAQIDDLQLSMARLEKEHNRREECSKQEINDLMRRLEESDSRNDDLTQGVTSATKPLLRQIENLQSSFSAQSITWEQVEKNLSERLAEAHVQLAAAVEKERVVSEQAMEVTSRVSTLGSQLATVKQEKNRLSAELEVQKMKSCTLQEEKENVLIKIDRLKQTLESSISDMRGQINILENQLKVEKNKLESEQRKYTLISEQLHEKELQIQEMSHSRNTSSPSLPEKRSSPRLLLKQEELLERALSTSSLSGSVYDNMRNNSSTTVIEQLESQLKLREGEIVQLQNDLVELEKTRESLTNELVRLTEENLSSENKIAQLSKVQLQYTDLNVSYNALLQMYGEKEEQVNELSMDLMDVKEMYKQQLERIKGFLTVRRRAYIINWSLPFQIDALLAK